MPEDLRQAIDTSAVNRTPEQKKLMACRFFMNGQCREGDACEYSHDADVIAAFKRRKEERGSSSSSSSGEDKGKGKSKGKRRGKKGKAFAGTAVVQAAASIFGIDADVIESAPVPHNPQSSRSWGTSFWKAAKTAAISMMVAPRQLPKEARQVAWAPTLESVQNIPII